MTQKLIIRFEHEEGCEQTQFEREDISGNDPLFWEWFMKSWEALGLPFIKQELDK